MTRTTSTLTVLALALTVAGTSAFARGQGPDFATLDTDGNGELSQAELQAAGQARFDAVDTDGDGFLSQAELEARGNERAKRQAARMLERLDTNDDGKISSEEMTQRRNAGKMFDRIDADNSGSITQAEFDAARDKFRERRAERGDKN